MNQPQKKTCDWCKARMSAAKGTVLGKVGNTDKVWFICDVCNLKHDVV